MRLMVIPAIIADKIRDQRHETKGNESYEVDESIDHGIISVINNKPQFMQHHDIRECLPVCWVQLSYAPE